MDRMIFINLPVADLPRAVAFYESVGATRNRQFSDDTAAMVTFSQAINVMLLTHARWATFTDRPIADPKSSEVLLALSNESRAAIDALIDTAVKAGGQADPCVKQDHGFMYGRSFTDLDGHVWESVWMDPAAIADGPPDMKQAELETA
jgi:predicted lactoylglutathione lyase